jgi:hypothetical protein
MGEMFDWSRSRGEIAKIGMECSIQMTWNDANFRSIFVYSLFLLVNVVSHCIFATLISTDFSFLRLTDLFLQFWINFAGNFLFNVDLSFNEMKTAIECNEHSRIISPALHDESSCFSILDTACFSSGPLVDEICLLNSDVVGLIIEI